jgi:hypothetical protein
MKIGRGVSESMRKRNQLLTGIAFLALIVLVVQATAGCGGVQATHVVTADTEYYRDGPQQARPADGVLPAGTLVRLVSDSGSYSLVETSDRMRAYVAGDSLQPLR